MKHGHVSVSTMASWRFSRESCTRVIDQWRVTCWCLFYMRVHTELCKSKVHSPYPQSKCHTYRLRKRMTWFPPYYAHQFVQRWEKATADFTQGDFNKVFCKLNWLGGRHLGFSVLRFWVFSRSVFVPKEFDASVLVFFAVCGFFDFQHPVFVKNNCVFLV